MASLIELFPFVSRLRMMRNGAASSTPALTPARSSPRRPVKGFYINGGWGTGGWKATPGSGHIFADLVARDEPNAIAAPFSMERFVSGALVAEHGAAAVAH
jgi:sarcosine oxidase subunit beta